MRPRCEPDPLPGRQHSGFNRLSSMMRLLETRSLEAMPANQLGGMNLTPI
jgi:hypothetical protein